MNWIQIPGIVGHSSLPTRLAPEFGHFYSAVFMPIPRNVYGGQSSPNTFSLALTQTKGKRTTGGEPIDSILKLKTQTPKVTGLLSAPNIPTSHVWWLLLYTDTSFSTSPSKDSNLPLPWQAHQGAKWSPKGALFSSVLFIVSFKHNLWNIYYVPHSLPSIRNTIVN